VAAQKKPAVLQSRQLKAKALEFDLQTEMLPLLQRVRGNKSKRTAKTLVKEGPLRVLVVALDSEGTLEEHKVDGPFSVQCLLGRVNVRLGSDKKDLRTGDLLVVDAGVTHNVEAVEPSILLITITLGGSE
jgi:quercetin dioxygenase-like cupin family protein